MWSKAAPKKAAANKAEKKRPAANAGRLGAVDAGAALDMAQQSEGASTPHAAGLQGPSISPADGHLWMEFCPGLKALF